MAMFWEFFTFELKFRAKSVSTYVYFLIWFLFSFFSVASESFGPIGAANGKVLLNGPFAISFDDVGAVTFGIIIVAAIFGTSILRDFQRDTYQMLFTKPIAKGSYLGGRWAGSLVTTLFAFSGLLVGMYAGTFAPWADHARIAPNHLWWYLQPFLSIVVVQVFFLGSLFFAVAALTRRIFIVYLQGVALFMVYLIGITVYSATRSIEHFWSGILDPLGFVLVDNIARYWTVLEKNTQLLPWDFSGTSPGFSRWSARGCSSRCPPKRSPPARRANAPPAPAWPTRRRTLLPGARRCPRACRAAGRYSARPRRGASMPRSRASVFARSCARCRSGGSSG
jgi:ABC-2 type transport system permease protein